MNNKALIAMSGGVDSSVSAALMIEKGYDCIGVTMKLYENETIGMEKE
ncbi:MAG: tRNA 2-thiouridine(34) synthase MnmA, partial [Lachnospiraceae bacterium]|nr:tRNA 2-thiouridine(34) synthase MnmA [Lachnospiraceae bacterium]